MARFLDADPCSCLHQAGAPDPGGNASSLLLLDCLYQCTELCCSVLPLCSVLSAHWQCWWSVLLHKGFAASLE